MAGKRNESNIAASKARFHDSFRVFSEALDKKHDTQRMIGTASREVTAQSKKVIFQLHRLKPENRDRILSQSEKSLAMIRKHVASAICTRITSETFYEHHRYISPGFQEYIEAASLFHYLKHGTLPSPQDLQDEFLKTYKENDANVLPLHMDDYILGIADVTGELMRRAISHRREAEHIREVLERVLRGCEGVRGIKSRDWTKKLQVMKASLEKVERTLFRNVISDAELQNLSTAAT